MALVVFLLAYSTAYAETLTIAHVSRITGCKTACWSIRRQCLSTLCSVPALFTRAYDAGVMRPCKISFDLTNCDYDSSIEVEASLGGCL